MNQLLAQSFVRKIRKLVLKILRNKSRFQLHVSMKIIGVFWILNATQIQNQARWECIAGTSCLNITRIGTQVRCFNATRNFVDSKDAQRFVRLGSNFIVVFLLDLHFIFFTNFCDKIIVIIRIDKQTICENQSRSYDTSKGSTSGLGWSR
jgi:hypothetical protein